MQRIKFFSYDASEYIKCYIASDQSGVDILCNSFYYSVCTSLVTPVPDSGYCRFDHSRGGDRSLRFARYGSG